MKKEIRNQLKKEFTEKFDSIYIENKNLPRFIDSVWMFLKTFRGEEAAVYSDRIHSESLWSDKLEAEKMGYCLLKFKYEGRKACNPYYYYFIKLTDENKELRIY